MNKLSSNQINRITKRFINPKHPNTSLHHPYQSDYNLIATDAQVVLFLSNRIVDEAYNVQSNLSEQEANALKRIESHYFYGNKLSKNMLSLDDLQLKSIIKSLNQHQATLSSKNTSTILSYDKSVNELSFTTMQQSFNFQQEQSFFRPADTSDTIDSFSILVDTNSFVKSLQTQLETDSYTTIEQYEHYIILANDYSTIVLMKMKEYQYTNII